MNEESDSRNPVEVIAEEFVTRRRRGESPSLDDYVARHPEYAAELRAVIPAALAMEQVRERSGPSVAPAAFETIDVDRLGDFELIREIGRGGMGIVYEAEQRSLGRRVALKILPRHALSDPNKLARFQREAETAARLHHTNIVPVFGVGEQDGLHYFVMQLIRGVSLDAVLATLQGKAPRTGGASAAFTAQTAARALADGDLSRLSATADIDPAAPTAVLGQHPRSRWESVARIGVQVADALDYAHSHGTLHRDIKPANLILDDSGAVWITDFGIAKAVEGDVLTQSGDFVGTLQYMAPEQAAGSFDVRGDVYGLGITLYELITHRRAYEESSASVLLERIKNGDPPPPSRFVPDCPRDLETIVMKAIAREPGHRYPTAGEFADDLRRFLEDRPIRARRVTPIEQLWRWCRRNRALATASATAAAAVFVAAIVGWGAFMESRATLRRESQLRAEADAARGLAEANLDLSLQALEVIFDRVAGPDPSESVLNSEGDGASTGETETESEANTEFAVSEKDAEVLREILVFYDRFAERNADNDRLQRETARARRRVGDISLRLRRLGDAERAYTRALEIVDSLLAKAADRDSLVAEAARIERQLGWVKAFSRRRGESRDHYRRALERLEKEADPVSMPRTTLELVRTLGGPAGLFAGRAPFGRRRPGRPRRGDADRAERTGPDGAPQASSAGARRREVVARQRRVVALCEALHAAHPDEAEFDHERGRALFGLYRLLHRSKDPEAADEAERALARAIAIHEAVVERQASVDRYRIALAEALAARARSESEDVRLQTLERARSVVAADAGEPRSSAEARACWVRRTIELASAVRRRDPANAAALLTRAVAVAKELRGGAFRWFISGDLHRASLELARALLDAGDRNGADAVLLEREADLREALKRRSEPRRLNRLAEILERRAVVARAAGDTDRAAGLEREAAAARKAANERRGRRGGRRPRR